MFLKIHKTFTVFLADLDNELKKIDTSPTAGTQFVFGRSSNAGSVPGSSASSAHNSGKL